MINDDLGDRMKLYEGLSNPTVLPRVPFLARLDGRTFHSVTKYCERPFSEPFHALMTAVTIHLVTESCATVGYTQSDEITLAWIENPFFGGNIQKMCSTLAAMATERFNRHPQDLASGISFTRHPTFDCRAWVVPSLAEAANVFVWRQIDATRNSVQMAAHANFSHKSLDGLDSKQLQEKLFAEKQINWSEYPAWAKRGTFVRYAKTRKPFTAAEIESLPPMHDARRNPDLVVERRVLQRADLDLRALPDRIERLFTDAAPA